MASTYTTNLGIEKIATGEQSGTWGNTTNTNLDLIDQAINGIVQITVAATGSTGSPNALTITNGSASDGRNKFIDFYSPTDLGGTVYYQLDPNDAEKIAFVRNSLGGGQTLVLFQGTYNASNDVEVPNGVDMLVKFDGTGASATVTNVFEKLQVNALSVNDGNITNVGDIALDSISADGTQIDIDITDNTASAFTISEGANNYIAITTTNGSELITVSKNSTFAGTTIADLGVVTTVDINGGTADNVTIGGGTAADGTFTTATATTGNITTVNATTVDTTNIEVTNVKAKDGTASATIADSTGVMTIASSVLTTTDINGGTIDGVTIGGASAGAITGTTITGTSFVSSGDMTFGDDDKAIFGAGNDLQIYHSSDSVHLDASNAPDYLFITTGTSGFYLQDPSSNILVELQGDGISLNYNSAAKIATTSTGIDVTGTVTATQVDITAQGDLRLQDTTGGQYVALQAPGTIATSYTLTLPVDDGTNGQALTTDGSGVLSWATAGVTGPASSTDNAIARYDGTTGDLIQNSGVTIDDSNNVSGVGTVATTGDATINGLTVGEGAGSIATNVAVGQSALAANTTGNLNTAVGADALISNTVGRCNTAVGNSALYDNISGCINTAVGINALTFNQTGCCNTAAGNSALRLNTAGCCNTAVGTSALDNTTGSSNTAVGTRALCKNTTAPLNTAVGKDALMCNTTGTCNTALGMGALCLNTTASFNTAVGAYALQCNTTGTCNTALGRTALCGNTEGFRNTAVGLCTGTTITTGSNLTVLGFCAQSSSATATNEVTLGNALVTSLRVPGVGLSFDTTDGFIVPKTITAVATTGAQTIDKTAGSVNFAAAATSLVVTNSFVDANSVILATVATNDATMKSVAAVASAGSFTLHANAGATAETRVNWFVAN
jgi:hypothetical protein